MRSNEKEPPTFSGIHRMSDGKLVDLQAWVGKSHTTHSELPLFQTEALAGAIGAPATPNTGDPLPLPWHWLYFLEPVRRDGTGEDGHPLKGGFLPPVALPRRMWASGKLEVTKPLILGLSAEKVSVITSVESKDGRSGKLVFVNLRHEFNQADKLCITEEQNLVYREAPKERTALPAGNIIDSEPQFTRKMTPDPILLFRFSALTYNAHRIHYDREYAVNEELYPALVVHGPLLATLLLNLAYENLPNARIETFSFRAVRPTFDSHPITLCGRRSGNELLLWSEDHEGYCCMRAEATIGS